MLFNQWGGQLLGGGGVFVPSGSPTGWWKADALGLSDTDPVATWSDSTSNGNDLTQATGLSRPTYIADGQNGLPTVRFDGSDDALSNETMTVTRPATLFLVFKQLTWTVSERIIDSSAVINGMLLYQETPSPGTVLFENGGFHTPTLDLDTWGVMTLRWNGASSLARLNGADEVTGSFPTSNTSTGITVGADAIESNTWGHIEVAEIILYEAAEDPAANEAGLMTKWGIS